MAGDYDYAWDDQDPDQIQEHYEFVGPEDTEVEGVDDEESNSDPDCECCEDCELSGFTESECECIKCQTCRDCENTCEEGSCEECHHHEDECDCDKYCECCEVCERADWLQSECKCAQCETCFACENSCDADKCATCFSHVVNGNCENCLVTKRLTGESGFSAGQARLTMAPKRAFRNWSKSERSIMRSLFTSGMPLVDIATHLDRTENAVVVQLANLGLLSEVDLSNAVHQAQLRYRRATRSDPETSF